MCDGHDPLLLVHEARCAIDSVLDRYLRLPVSKALNLSSRTGFDNAAALLAGQLRRTTASVDANAVREAIRGLDVDWTKTTAEQRGRLIAEAMSMARTAAAPIADKLEVPLSRTGDEVVRAVRSDVRRRHRLAVGADLNALDERIVRHVVSSQGNYVRDEYGRRVESLGAEARRIVAEGLEEGLGREEIAADLEVAAKAALIERSPAYWELVASSFIGQGRSFAQMSSYAEAGIERYMISAVLDENTTEICRFLDGKVFSVGRALDQFAKVESLEDPEEMKGVIPWVREAIDGESGRRLLVAGSGEHRFPLAEITRSAMGTRDDPGEFRALCSDAELGASGVGFPPYHGYCRSTTVPV